MSFRNERNSADGLYIRFLESGGVDVSALEIGADSAWQALRKVSAAQLHSLTQEQQDQWGHLIESYKALPDGVDGQRWRRRWFEAARELLFRLPD